MSQPRIPAAEPSWGKRADLDVLNRDIPRVDGPDKVTGRAVYTHDVRIPGMLYAALLRHPVPRALVESIDVSAAEALPGVVHVLQVKEAGDELRYSGDDSVLAVVSAETPEAARDGVRAIVVKAENLEPVVDTERAKEADAPLVNYRRRADSNVAGSRARGDEEKVKGAIDASAKSVEVSVEIPTQHHVCLETHGHVIHPKGEGERSVVYASTQMVSQHGGQLVRPLGLENGQGDKVHVLTPHMGGGFGSKFGAGVEGMLCARIARETGRPVHLMLSRADEFAMGGNRSGSKQTLKLAGDADGKFTAIHVVAERHGGQGGGAFAGAPYQYEVPEVYLDAKSVKTAADSNRAMRAPGHPQASFGMETAVDMLAYETGVDPLTIRKRNLAAKMQRRQLDRVAAEIGWDEHPNKLAPGVPENGIGVGIGFGVCRWTPGGRRARCSVTVRPDGSVVSATATQDLGTGARTYVAAIVAEELGLEVGQVTARIGDSDLPPNVASGGSVTTGSSAPAIKDAAHNAREALEALLEDVLGAEVGDYVWKAGRVHAVGDPERSLAWKEVCALLRQPLEVSGQFQQSLYEGRILGAQAAKVEVDTMTGRVKVLKMVAIQDQGLPLNRMALRSQINGGMIQALSYGLLEQRVFDKEDGFLLSDNLQLYKIAGAQEMPEMVSIIDDSEERDSVCGMAEAPIIPGQSAIANAIYNACGVRMTRMPFTPDNVLTAIHGSV
ncbi:MAG: xanthine dehydrogenase family protein molybdopterin-binding subunit [Planctomycetota bacterium]|nr:xanthine dehydrogenase family protein molybdopterin-binding subunit [Planctomycetota bacterium]MEC8510679.1 xanthine dehydrogenase family protein molybdopterin-binding subunit [Planctomycetota bacterium]